VVTSAADPRGGPQGDDDRCDRPSVQEHRDHLHDSGNIVTLRSPLTNLAIFLDRLGQYEPAATIEGFAFSPLTAASVPKINTAIAHLRHVLGDQAYESLARRGEAMAAAAMASYAYDQIDRARAELIAASK
jgi:hypothetical protein